MPRTLPVYVDGRIYRDAREAAEAVGMDTHRLRRALQRGQDTLDGHPIEYGDPLALKYDPMDIAYSLPARRVLDHSRNVRCGGLLGRVEYTP